MTEDQKVRLAEAKKMRGLVIEAMEALMKRGAKSWTIGGQQYTAQDISELLKMLQYWDAVIAGINGGQRTIRRIVPVDD
jgi:calcineurin-like phosphoesterase